MNNPHEINLVYVNGGNCSDCILSSAVNCGEIMQSHLYSEMPCKDGHFEHDGCVSKTTDYETQKE